MNPQYEFRRRQHDKALDAVAITEKQLRAVQVAGQLSLFAEQQPPQLAARRNDYDDFAQTCGATILYPVFANEYPDITA